MTLQEAFDAALAHPVGSEILPFLDTRPRWRRIADEVRTKHLISRPDLFSRCLRAEVVACRDEVMWRLKHDLGWSLAEIGRRLGRDRAAVLYAVRRHEARMRAMGETAE